MTTTKERCDAFRRRIGELAYERLELTRKVEELDQRIAAYEAALEAADQIRRDTDTQAAIQAAKETSSG